ncbi:DUF928 domain-containing protein [Aerosakkonemataceae cyanobacterium BLCC-F154]|uniref:DUF928 domain-containing protein n=1 Tax=Floridaenema fluviatile BLCC-F154 TaxID=3153640 RepID=A0ABV4Y8D2_9CYAN
MVAKDFCLYLSIFLLVFPLKLAFGSTAIDGIKDISQYPVTVDGGIRNTDDMPVNSDGGATRGRCLQDPDVKPELMLLIPDRKEGLTVEKSPSFFVFVPQTKAKKGEFVLYDRTDKKLVYRTIFELSGVPGIISIQIPKDREYLKINNNYEWRFSLYCKLNDDRSEDVIRVGLIKRVEPNGAIAKIQGNPNPLEKARVYQKNNLWYDALKTVAELRPTTGKNSNAATMWQELLQAENLTEIVSYPLIDCCKPTN